MHAQLFACQLSLFRANLVIQGCPAIEEWVSIIIANVFQGWMSKFSNAVTRKYRALTKNLQYGIIYKEEIS